MKTAALVVALAALPAAVAAQPYPVNPGYWEVKENWLGLYTHTERVCLTQRNITKFLSKPFCNHIYRCDYSVDTVADGKIRFEGVFSKSNERYHLHGAGDYSPTTLHMSAAGSGHWNILPVAGSASMDGRFLGDDCPADAKRFK
jgi:hypothetical protein